LRLTGNIPPEIWNRLGTRILPKLRSGSNLRIGLEFTVDVDENLSSNLNVELEQIINDLGLSDQIEIKTISI